MSNDSLKNIIGVALGVCLVCSILVATAAVLLKPKQVANQTQEKLKNVLLAGGLIQKNQKDVDIKKVFAEKIEPALVDLETGEQLPKEKMTGNFAPEAFDVKKLSKEPETSHNLTAAEDKADIKRIPKYMMVYFVKEGDHFSRVILPVHGTGLWSTMYGFLALDSDLRTIKGFTIYEHGETPGLGGEIENPQWQADWEGKTVFDKEGNYILKILKGKAAPGSSIEIDGLSGATLTTRGVDNMIAFWLGADGYGPFLDKLKTKQEK